MSPGSTLECAGSLFSVADRSVSTVAGVGPAGLRESASSGVCPFARAPARALRDPERVRRQTQIIAEQRNVGGLDAGRRSGAAHDDADIGSRERRSIIHTIAEHATPWCISRYSVTASTFSSGSQLGAHFSDAELVSLRVDPRRTAEEVRRRAEEKIADVEERIRDLRAIRRAPATAR